MSRCLPLFTIALLFAASASAQFGPRTDVLTGETYWCLKAADLDNDGDNDLVFCGGGHGVYRLENLDGQGTFGPLETLALVSFSAAMPLDLADVEGDGDLDVVVHVSNGPQVLWLANDGSGNFSSVQPLVSAALPVGTNTLICADVMGSPLPEILLSGGDHVHWFMNNGGAFTMSDSVQHGLGNFLLQLVGVGDVDQDGDVDHVAKGQDAFYVGVNPGNGGAWTSVPLTGSAPSGYYYGVDLIDVEGDSDLDLVDAGFHVRWTENLVANGGSWLNGPDHVVAPFAPNEGAGWAAHLGCGPGASILWCHWGYTTPPYWSHYDDALGGFTAPVATNLRPAGDGRLFFGDLNGDGRLDVIITQDDTLSWHVNDLPATGGSAAMAPPLDTLCAWGFNGGYPLPDGLPAGGLWTGPYVYPAQPNLFWPAAFGQGAGTYPVAYGALDAQGCIASAFASVEVINEPTVEVTAMDPQCPDAVLQLIGAPAGGTWSAPADTQGRVYTDCALRPIFTDVVYTFTDVTGHPCPSDVPTTVYVLPCTPVFFGAVDPLCADAAPLAVPLAVPAGGVSYFLQGVDSSTFDGGPFVTGWFSPDQGPGLWPVVAAAVAPGECPFPDTLLVEVLSAPLVSFALALDTLTDCTAVLPLTEGQPSGGLYTIDGSTTSYTAFEAVVWGIGTHTVTYTVVDPNGCVGAVTDTLVVDCSTGIAGPMDPTARLWPNPADERLFLTYDGPPAPVELFDMMGRSVARWSATSSPMMVDVSHLPSGSYTLRMGSAAFHPVMIR